MSDPSIIEKFCALGVSIDWQAIAGFAGAGAVIWAAHVAKSTIKDIRRQHASAIQVSTAQSVLEVIYKIERSLYLIRKSENIRFVSAFDHMQESEGLHGAELRKISYYERLVADQKEPFSELSTLIPKARALFGDTAASKLVKISLCETRISAALQQLRAFHELGRDLFGPKGLHPGLDLGDEQYLNLDICENKLWPILQSDTQDRSQMQQQFEESKKFMEAELTPIIRTDLHGYG